MKRFTQALFVAILFVGFSATSFAQSSATDNITAQAEVISDLAITGVQNLNFDQVYVGTSESVSESDNGAGHFQISYSSGTQVDLNFNLPNNLSSGSETLDINFGPTDASWDGDTANNIFNPNQSETATVGSDNLLDVYIGGTVNPTSNQAVGTYTGQVTLTANYN